jgi:hypothetical protein
MPSSSDFATAGKVIAVNDGQVVFVPRGTTYQLHLKFIGSPPPVNVPMDALIHAQARKVWTVPSGGNFIVPIVGTPRIVQGRVKYLDEKQAVVQAGANVIVDLPAVDSAIDLPNGPIAIGTMVNVTVMPGASIEFVTAPAGASA